MAFLSTWAPKVLHPEGSPPVTNFLLEYGWKKDSCYSSLSHMKPNNIKVRILFWVMVTRTQPCLCKRVPLQQGSKLECHMNCEPSSAFRFLLLVLCTVEVTVPSFDFITSNFSPNLSFIPRISCTRTESEYIWHPPPKPLNHLSSKGFHFFFMKVEGYFRSFRILNE